jgi:hypothetical protein
MVLRGGGTIDKVTNAVTKAPDFKNVSVEKRVEIYEEISMIATNAINNVTLAKARYEKRMAFHADNGTLPADVSRIDPKAVDLHLESAGLKKFLEKVLFVQEAIKAVLPKPEAPKELSRCEKISKHQYFLPAAVAATVVLTTIADRLIAKHLY